MTSPLSDPIVLQSIGPLDQFVDLLLFLIGIVAVCGCIGLVSKSMTMGAFGAFLGFVHVASESQHDVFMTLLYAILTIVIVIMGFRVWSYMSGTSSGGGAPS